jgi:uncharacterized repeat protein (TIGR03803 family)
MHIVPFHRLARRLLALAAATVAPAIPAEAAPGAPASPYSVVYRCQAGPESCAFPDGGVIQGSDGNFYGTSEYGGANGVGAIFKLTPDGVFTILHSFSGSDGEQPMAGLVQASDGNFYGTSVGDDLDGGNLYGTLFQMSPAGDFKVMHVFVGGATDGHFPAAPLIQASDGNLYGTALDGGAHNRGTVFRLSLSGEYTTLYSFPLQGGGFPQSALTETPDGFLWGTTVSGGSGGCGNSDGCGTLFKMSFDGQVTVTHRFEHSDQGSEPNAALLLASDGALYGTTQYGGNTPGCIANGCGTIFRITLDQTFTTVHRFQGTNGSYPEGTLLQASDGNLYGTTWEGGKDVPTCRNNDGCGTVFRFTPTGEFTRVHSFHDVPDGAAPVAGLIQASDGSLWGTTQRGGSNRMETGVVFRLSQ